MPECLNPGPGYIRYAGGSAIAGALPRRNPVITRGTQLGTCVCYVGGTCVRLRSAAPSGLRCCCCCSYCCCCCSRWRYVPAAISVRVCSPWRATFSALYTYVGVVSLWNSCVAGCTSSHRFISISSAVGEESKDWKSRQESCQSRLEIFSSMGIHSFQIKKKYFLSLMIRC